MLGYAIILVGLGLPLALGLIFRVSTSYLFFSIMSGELLARYLGDEAAELMATELNRPILTTYAEVILFVLPVLLTALFLRNSMNMRQMIWHAIPLALTGIIFAAALLPLLPTDIQAEVQSHKIGSMLIEMDGIIISVVVTIQLLALWLLNQGRNRKNGKKKD